ncbi:hypothetical protein CW740_11985 [Kangiella profundi]|uniref:Uncharacterized protein n=1 Tax=Kangiella profundi TaxID=1561924 RepID=A0A2K9AXR4_9GAMM|nr:hypothetical protein [Kangiella profundi]AUD79931.1 hypothetical protein CW740_11985 [Kangiella profundi]
MSKLAKKIILLLLIINALFIILRIPQVLLYPTDELYYELAKANSSYSNMKVKILMKLGADPAEQIFPAEIYNESEYGFGLLRAIENSRIEIIPILIADYSEAQKKRAIDVASKDQKVKQLVINLMNK